MVNSGKSPIPVQQNNSQVMREHLIEPGPGLAVLVWGVLGLPCTPLGILLTIVSQNPVPAIVGVVISLVAVFFLTGLFTVSPNEAKVLQLFGTYQGTVRKTGLHWLNPFLTKNPVTLRIHNFESQKLKVNDRSGSPIEIAAVIVWRVVDTAEAVFHVDDYSGFVKVQSESALRTMALSYPYDSHETGEIALQSHTVEVANHLKKEIQERLKEAGVEVLEARISHLAYAPEIAHAMLQRQQASAVIAARQKIVEGAVGMVEMALERLQQHKVVDLDGATKSQLIGNLLVVLCSERGSQPTVSVGS